MKLRWSQLLLLALPAVADAHIVASRLGDFYAGALHPATDLQDIVLWLATGLLAASMGASRGRWLVLAVPLGTLIGLCTGLSFGLSTTPTALNAALMVVLGLMIATNLRMPTLALCVIALAVAIVRGIANAGGVGPDTNRILFGAGLTMAAHAAITLIMALVVSWETPGAGWRRITVRVVGSWIAAIGLMIGAFALLPHKYDQAQPPPDTAHTSAHSRPRDAS